MLVVDRRVRMCHVSAVRVTAMDAGLKAFLASHADAEVLDNGKVRCTLTGHELPPRLDALQAYWGGKNYRKRAERAAYDFSKHEPWLVQHTKSEHLLWCTLTGRPVSRSPKAVEGHVHGLRFLKLRKEARAKAKAADAGEAGGKEAGSADEFDPDEWSFVHEAERGDEETAQSDAEPAAEEPDVDAAGDDDDAFWVRGREGGKSSQQRAKAAASKDARGTARGGAGKRSRADGGKREAAGAPARKQRRAEADGVVSRARGTTTLGARERPPKGGAIKARQAKVGRRVL